MASATRKPRAQGDGGFGHAGRRAPKVIVVSRLLASATRVAMRPGDCWSSLLASATLNQAPKPNSSSKRESALLHLAFGRLSALPLPTGSRRAAAGLWAAIGLTLPSGQTALPQLAFGPLSALPLPSRCWLAAVGLPLLALGPQLACRNWLAALANSNSPVYVDQHIILTL